MKNKDITTHIIVEVLAKNIQESRGINPQCYIEKAGRKSDGIYDKYTYSTQNKKKKITFQKKAK